MDQRRLLADLDPDQRRAVTETTHPLCILAPAGSGKTRVLTRRIAYRILEGEADPRHVLALTFTRKAAGELRARLGAFGLRDRPHAGTFHAIAWAQVRVWYRDELQRSMPALLGHKARFIGDLPSRGSLPVAELASEIEWAGARTIAPEDYPRAAQQEDRRPSAPFEHVAALMVEYAKEKQRAGVMDFDDMLGLCAGLFEKEARFASTQRWRFRHLFVDEFQDVNPLQHRVLQGWLGDRTDLCVVGDPNQSIYRWNGATADYLQHFADHHPGAAVVDLRRNYRSTPQILHVAASVLGRGAQIGFTAHRPAGEVPTFRRLDSDVVEAREIAREARLLHGPSTRWDSQAVLVRTNAQMSVIETAFARAHVPFRSRTGDPLSRRPEIRAAMRQVAAEDHQPLGVVVSDLSMMAVEAAADADGTSRAHALETLLRLAQELDASDPAATAKDLWGYLRTSGGEGVSGSTGDAVEILTFHAAKGLEWPIVHIAGLEDGLVPLSRARSAEAEAEERRLLHVAMTRATNQLRLSMAFTRSIRGREVGRRATPYAAAIDGALDDLRRLERIDPSGGLHRARAALATARPDDLDRALLAALQSWRAEVARRAGIAAPVVASDRVLGAIARHRPIDRAALTAVLGVGPMVVDAHGEDILRIVSTHAAAAGAP